MRLWYDRPATVFEEALPIGNGRMGGLVYGGADTCRVSLNDITFWTGRPYDLSVDSAAYHALPAIREALFNEQYAVADSLQHLLQGTNSQYYLPLATLYLSDMNRGEVTGYRRSLSLDSAVVSDRYTRAGVTIERQYFATHPDSAIVIRLHSSRPRGLNMRLCLTSPVPHRADAEPGQIILRGVAPGDTARSIHFMTIASVRLGKDAPAEPQATAEGYAAAGDSSIVILNATDATIVIVNATSFNGFDKDPVSQGRPYESIGRRQADRLGPLSAGTLLSRHLADYQAIFGRVKLSLAGMQFNSSEPTDRLLRHYGSDASHDRYLEALYFQFGRYLLISSSRTKAVPANLQGLWNEQVRAPWRSNYTVNINLEENYWPCDVAAMPEMFTPLATFAQALSVTGHANAHNYYGIRRGWCSSHNADLWAMSNPVGEKRESPTWSNWNMGGAWLMQNLYDHYLYTQDRDYLRLTAYPLMRGAAEFMLDWLVPNPKQTLPDGRTPELITAPSTSPEAYYITPQGYHGATMYGGTADLAIIRELFRNTIEAATVLKRDRAFRDTLQQAIDRLHPYTIGHQGDLNEWYYDWADEDSLHRHQSHLIGLYPGHQITIDKTPRLAKAATRTLEIKGDNTTGWSSGWRICLWARLHRGREAFHIYQQLLRMVDPHNPKDWHGGTYPNLLDAHPPFQIDGNFGGVAGVCEMLMQSGADTITLLPACPEQWAEGEVSGLRVRGGYTIDFAWQGGRVTQVTLSGVRKASVTLIANGQAMAVSLRKGKAKTIRL